jgi:hypothetical protein
VRGVLDMRARQHALHFVINDELLPHAIVKIPDGESVHMGVWMCVCVVPVLSDCADAIKDFSLCLDQ